MEEWRYSFTILEHYTRWSRVVSVTLQPIYHRGKSPCYTLNRRVVGPQSRSGFNEEEKTLPLPGI
jgi:hypothetical protein